MPAASEVARSIRETSQLFAAHTSAASDVEAKRSVRVPEMADVITLRGKSMENELFLGITSQEQALSLDLTGFLPGPLLVVSEQLGGKTDLLQAVAAAAALAHHPDDFCISVFTTHFEQWESIRSQYESIPLYLPQRGAAAMHKIRDRLHKDSPYQAELVIIDDFGEMLRQNSTDLLSDLRFILLRGAAHRVIPVVAIDTEDLGLAKDWMDKFRLHIFGAIIDSDMVHKLALQDAHPETLLPGVEYVMPQPEGMMRFWIPSVE